MKNYSYRVIRIAGQKDVLWIDFKEKKYEILSNFLGSEVVNFEHWIKEVFDKVINGESQYENESYNMCSIQVTPITTKIYNELALTDEEYYSTCCEVDTKELKQLIDEWCKKVKEFKNSQVSE